MIFSQSCVQFGGGRMGRVWVSALAEYFESLALVDPDPSTVDSVKNNHAHYFNLNILEEDEASAPFSKHLNSYMRNAAVWSLAVRSGVHEDLISRALDEEIRGLIIENPVADDLERLEGLVDTVEERGIITGVNYVELVHPVFEAIVERAVDEEFIPQRGFHWRSKDISYKVGAGKKYPDGTPFIKTNLAHDVAEVYALYRALINADLIESDAPDYGLSVVDVDDVELWSDVPFNQEYPFRDIDCDSGTQTRLSGPNDSEFTCKGSYSDEDERRFFLWIGEKDKSAFYGNTLQAEHTTPAAYKIVGVENVQEAEERLKSGEVVTKSQETELMNDVNGRPVSFPQAAYNERTARMCRRVFSNDSPATLRDALHIERITAAAYEKAGLDVPTYVR